MTFSFSTLSTMPKDALVVISDFLPIKDLISLTKTNRRLRHICDEVCARRFRYIKDTLSDLSLKDQMYQHFYQMAPLELVSRIGYARFALLPEQNISSNLQIPLMDVRSDEIQLSNSFKGTLIRGRVLELNVPYIVMQFHENAELEFDIIYKAEDGCWWHSGQTTSRGYHLLSISDCDYLKNLMLKRVQGQKWVNLTGIAHQIILQINNRFHFTTSPS